MIADAANPIIYGILQNIIPETGLPIDPPSVTVAEELKNDITVPYLVYITG